MYPKFFLRGISREDFIKNGFVTIAVFQFDDDAREDGYRELSINWYDDDDSLTELLSQLNKKGCIQFTGGATKMLLSEVKNFMSPFIQNKLFSFERKEIENNKYHGNLLIYNSVTKQEKAMIQNSLAMIASKNIITK